jgi:hypothetical protein
MMERIERGGYWLYPYIQELKKIKSERIKATEIVLPVTTITDETCGQKVNIVI